MMWSTPRLPASLHPCIRACILATFAALAGCSQSNEAVTLNDPTTGKSVASGVTTPNAPKTSKGFMRWNGEASGEMRKAILGASVPATPPRPRSRTHLLAGWWDWRG